MEIITPNKKISVQILKQMSEKMFSGIVKAVVDLEKEIMAVDADMHVDEETELLEQGSHQESLWGINLHPDKANTDEFIEFDSMINIRPAQDNRTRGVENPLLQKKIKDLVNRLVTL